MNETQFPYVGQNEKGINSFILSPSRLVSLDIKDWNNPISHGISSNHIFHREYKDITREYLANSKIRVESEEHGRSILELAERYGYKFQSNVIGKKYFYFYDDEQTFGQHKETFDTHQNKEIFLPMPPAEVKEEKPEEPDTFVLGNLNCKIVSKARQDEMVLNSTSYPVNEIVKEKPEPNMDEWPRIGDELYFYDDTIRDDGDIGYCIAKFESRLGEVLIAIEAKSYHLFIVRSLGEIEKTPEQKRQEAIDKIANELKGKFKPFAKAKTHIAFDNVIDLIASEIYDGNVKNVKYVEED